MKLYVRTVSEILEDYWDGEKYENWYQSMDTEIISVSTTKKVEFYSEEFNVPFDANIGDTVYVLYMTYSSGDSYGHSDGVHETIWIFKDYELAKSAKEAYHKANEYGHSGSLNNSYTVSVEVDGGQVLTLSNPSAGYFENMSNCDIQKFIIEK